MKTAAASVMSASAPAPPIWNRIRKTSAFLRKLSLNAAKNWVQNRGAKRRVINRDEDMALPPVPNGPRDPGRALNASSMSLPSPGSGQAAPAHCGAWVLSALRKDNGAKRTTAQRGGPPDRSKEPP